MLTSFLTNSHQDLLVLSFFNETRILSFAASNESAMQEDDTEIEAESEEIEEIDLPSFASTAATLHACNIGTLILQITSTGINYIDSGNEAAEARSWKHEEGKKITLATSDERYIVLAIEGGNAILLEESDGKLVLVT
jgi:hypothetical protein